jgi:peptidoglycan/LPS O-acetylase OafA/YrhL
LRQTFYSIQALRGLAAGLVVVAHIFEHPVRGDPSGLLLTGRFGVEIFFVISGLVMTHVAGDRSFNPGAFAIRRILRIVPLYWACSILVYGIALVAPALLKTTVADLPHLVLSLLFIPDPGPQAASDWRPLFKLGWTLNYEMFFYAALTALFWCRRGRQRSIILSLVLGSLILLSFAIPPKESMLAFYANIALMPFLVGVWMAEFSDSFAKMPRWGIVALIGASAIGVAALYRVPFAELRALGGHAIMTLAAMLLVATGLACENRFPQRGFLKMVGDSSYSLYLTHMFVVGFAWALLDRLHLPKLLQWGSTPFIAAAALLVAYCSFRLIETPFNRLAQRLTARPQSRQPAVAE